MEFLGLLMNEVLPLVDYNPVVINVYDVHSFSRWTSKLGLGLHHTGVVAFGEEFSYGGHDNGSSGIYKIPPLELEYLGDNMIFRATIQFGRTSRTKRDIWNYLFYLSKKFQGIAYNLLELNCNHFADEFLYFLVGCHLPRSINRLAFACHHVFSPVIPTSWVQYPMTFSASSASSQSPGSSLSGSFSSERKKVKVASQQRSIFTMKQKVIEVKEKETPAAEMNFLENVTTESLISVFPVAANETHQPPNEYLSLEEELSDFDGHGEGIVDNWGNLGGQSFQHHRLTQTNQKQSQRSF